MRAAAAAKLVPSFFVVVDVLSTADVTVEVTVVTDVRRKKARFSPPLNESSVYSLCEDTISGITDTLCRSVTTLTSTLFKGNHFS